MMNSPANLAQKLATFTDRFSPRTVATYNGNDVMVAKLEGPFHWHKHHDTDDFFLKGEEIFVNEVNTLPGFTEISRYPKLWEAAGLSQSDLMDILIAHALARHAQRRQSLMSTRA